jgi:hypothetical protein
LNVLHMEVLLLPSALALPSCGILLHFKDPAAYIPCSVGASCSPRLLQVWL